MTDETVGRVESFVNKYGRSGNELQMLRDLNELILVAVTEATDYMSHLLGHGAVTPRPLD